MTTGAWQAYLDKQFPAFLLKSAERRPMTPAAAEAFLECLGLGGDNLRLLRGLSLFAAHERELSEFATHWLPKLVRALPSGARVEQRTWRGGYQGRLDVPATMQLRASGDRSVFVTRARRRRFDLPENIFLRSLAGRTERLVADLGGKGFLAGNHWKGVADAVSALRFHTRSSQLRDVPEQTITAYHRQAAQNARHPAYRAALRWYHPLADALDHEDPQRLARLLSEGGLQPAKEPSRFELAVLLSLIEGIEQYLVASGEHETTRMFISHDREQVATFTRGSGTRIEVYYNQAVLPLDKTKPGPRNSGVRHYLDRSGWLRPDITVCVRRPDGSAVYTVFEIKLSDKSSYISSGYSEAIVYRHEYAEYLSGWPKAVLVTSEPLQGKPRPGDDVVAVAWNDLAASPIIASMLDQPGLL